MIIVLGVVLGLALAYMILNLIVKSSVVSGDSKGGIQDFTNSPLLILEKKDGCSPNIKL